MIFSRAALMQSMARAILFIACIIPFAWLIYGVFANKLGANPTEYITRFTGDWTLRMLCVVLAITPLRVMTKTPQLARFRRMLGLFVYFYVVLHLLAYSWFDMSFDLADIIADIPKRPFILVGFAAFLLLTPLAFTSFNRAIKALGAKRWQKLHKLVYVIAALGVLHFFWMRSGKNNYAEVYAYAAILASLLGWRVWNKFRVKPSLSQTPSNAHAPH
jgi:methionine sulfoxide reductase heme-binding subunit